jgi:hypothetical protein
MRHDGNACTGRLHMLRMRRPVDHECGWHTHTRQLEHHMRRDALLLWHPLSDKYALLAMIILIFRLLNCQQLKHI